MVNFLKFVASVVRFPDSMGYKFPRLWLNNKNEPINKIQDIPVGDGAGPRQMVQTCSLNRALTF
jgi:hypothetical protein